MVIAVETGSSLSTVDVHWRQIDQTAVKQR